MANIKITELNAATSLASTDVVPVVDVSEDETKKITASDLFRTLPDGTAAAPALSFASDAANGVYLAGTDTVGISTGGTQRVTVDGSGNVTISGGLTVEGQTTTVESTVVTIDDKNIELGSVASPSNTTADGGGITLKGATDKTIKWINSTGYWTFNTGIEVGGHLQIDDNNEIKIGTAADLVIRHNGTDTIFENDTGHVYLTNYANDKDIILRSDDGSGGIANYVVCDGSAGDVRLYKNGSQKLQTAAGGINVTGEVECDSLDVDGSADITGTLTLHGNLDLQDSDIIKLGSDDDLEIYHDGTDGVIRQVGAGDLYIQNTTDDKDVIIRSDNGSGGLSAYVLCDGSTGNVRLYHYGTEKFKTKSDGIDVIGEVQCDFLDVDGGVDIDGGQLFYDATNNLLRWADNAKATFGASDDLQIYHDGSNSFIRDAGAGSLKIRGTNLLLESAAGEAYIFCTADGSTKVYHNNDKKLETTSAGIDVTGEVQCDSLDVDGDGDVAGTLRVNRLIVDDDGSTSPTFSIRTDDSSPWAFTLGNDSYASSEGVGFRIYQANTGEVNIRHTGNSEWKEISLQQQNGSTTNTAIHVNASRAVSLRYQSVEKLRTKSDGVDITGELQCDSLDVDGAADITGTVTLHGHLDLQDNDNILIGSGDDFKLFHNGTNSHIENYTGGLYIDQQLNDGDLVLRSDNGSGGLTFYVNCDGSEGKVKLYHYGSEKLQTKSDGVLVTGELQSSSLDVDGAADISGNLTVDSGTLHVDATNNRVGINRTSPTESLDVSGNIEVTGQLYQSMPSDYWAQGNTFIELNGMGNLTHMGGFETCLTSNGYRNSSTQWTSYGANSTTGASQIRMNPTGYIAFGTESNKATGSSHNVTERLRLDSSGRLMLGTTTEGVGDADELTVAGSGNIGITIRSGSSSSGNIFFSDGTSGTAEYDGYIQYRHGDRALRFATQATERFRITNTGAWAIEGASNYGTSGQILTSNGNDAPSWQDAGSVAVGGASAISMNDSVKINFGNSNDLEIHHDGTHSRINDNGSGSLLLQSNGSSIQLNKGTSENMLVANTDADVELYYNGSKKLETKSDGVDIVGELQCDSLDVDGGGDIAGQLNVNRIVLRDNGSSSPLFALRADDSSPWAMIIGNDSYTTNTNYGLAFYQGNDGNVIQQIKGNGSYENYYLQSSNGSTTYTALQIDTNNAVNLRYQGNAKLQTKSDGIDVTGEVQCDTLDVDGTADLTGAVVSHDSFRAHNTNGGIYFGDNYGGFADSCAIARAHANNYHASGSSAGDLVIGPDRQKDIVFGTTTSSSGGLTARCKVTDYGHFVPQTNNSYDLGSSTLRWRNVYTNDLNLSNEGGTNDVDGTWGNYTIQEGEDDLFLINRRNGKKYKFNLTEVS